MDSVNNPSTRYADDTDMRPLALAKAVVALPYWWARNKLALLFSQEAKDAFEYAEGMRAEVEYYRRTTCAAADDMGRRLKDEYDRGYSDAENKFGRHADGDYS